MVERCQPTKGGTNEDRRLQLEPECADLKREQESFLQDTLKESYYRKPRYECLERPLVQDFMYSITTLDKMWTDPIIDSKLATFKFQNTGAKTKQPKDKEFTFALYDPKTITKKRDFIRDLINNYSQLYDTEKDYIVDYEAISDLIKDYVSRDSHAGRLEKLKATTFVIRVRLFSLLQQYQSLKQFESLGMRQSTQVLEDSVNYFQDSLQPHYWPAFSSLLSYSKSEPIIRNLKHEKHDILSFVTNLIDLHSQKRVDFEKAVLDHEPEKMLSDLQRQETIFYILHMHEGTKPLGFRSRLRLWVKSLNVRNMMSTMKDYVRELKDMELFPNLNFAQIEVDIPRMQFLQNDYSSEVTDIQIRDLCYTLFFNYTKRNSFAQYIQSQGRIGQKLAETVYFGNYEEDTDELLFWIYTCIMEDVLPIGFYNHMIEPQVLKELLNRVFQVIDPQSWEIMRDIPSLYFLTHFFSLFTEISNPHIQTAIFDLLIVAGSGTHTATLTHPYQVEISKERPLCRTSQLLVSIALAMIRIVIYDIKMSSRNSWSDEPLRYLTINEFEDQILARVTDSRRLLLEALQLESYLFSPKISPPPTPKKKEQNLLPNKKGPFNDWHTTLEEVFEVSSSKQQLKIEDSICADFVHQERARQTRNYEDQLLTKRSIVKRKKKHCSINRMNFLRNFPGFYALCKMSELPRFLDGKLIDSDFIMVTNSLFHQKTKNGSDNHEDEFLLEKYIVENFECQGPLQFPICLYDFTVKLEQQDVQIFRPENFDSLYQEYYFSKSDDWIFDKEGKFVRQEAPVDVQIKMLQRQDPKKEHNPQDYRNKIDQSGFSTLVDQIREKPLAVNKAPFQMQISSEENLADSSSENDQFDKVSFDSFEDFGTSNFGSKARPEKMKQLSQVLPIYRSQHICTLQSFQFCQKKNYSAPMIDFKQLFRQNFLLDPKLQPFEDKDLSRVFTNRTLLDSQVASSAVCQIWLLEFLLTLSIPGIELEHSENKTNFFRRLDELRDKHARPPLKQEFEQMESDLKTNDLFPYMYQAPPLVQRKGVLNQNKPILLFNFYNSISKQSTTEQTLLRKLDQAELDEKEEAKVNYSENRATRQLNVTPGLQQ